MLLGAEGRTVLVHVTAQNVAALTDALAGRGFVVKSSHPERHFVDGYVPLAQLTPGPAGRGLPAGACRPAGACWACCPCTGAAPARQQKWLRPAGWARTSSTTSGLVIGQAAYLLQAERVRALGGYDGRGQRIGVISGSFDQLGTAAASMAAGDLPAEGV